MFGKGISSFIKGNLRPVCLSPVAIISLTFFLFPGTRALFGQTDPLDVPFPQPQYVLRLIETYTTYGTVHHGIGKSPHFYMLLPYLPNKDGVVARPAYDGGTQYFSKAEVWGGPYRTPREVCAATQVLRVPGNSVELWRVRCPEATPPPKLQPKPKEQPAPPSEPKAGEKQVEPAEQKAEEKPAEAEKKEETVKDSKCTEEVHDEEVREIHKAQDHVSFADEEYQNSKAKLGMMRLAAAKIRPKIGFLDDAIVTGHFDEKMKDKLDGQVENLRRELNDILQEQDIELGEMLYKYDFALGELRDLGQKSKCDDVKKTAQNLEQQLKRRRDMVELELLLASSEPGDRNKFHALARKFMDEKKYKDYVNLLRAMDFVERKDPRSALYALRQAMKDNPDNPAVREMLKKMELGYLRAIDAKITGEAAEVRARLWESLGEHGEEGFLGVLHDLLNTGVTTASLAIGGKYESLADLTATIGDEAQVQHSGLILILRLREAGISLSDIRDMVIKDKLSGDTPQDFAAAVKEKFGWNLNKEQALKMRFSINMAFKNPDVGRLGRDNKEQFNIDVGNVYFKTEAFDNEWTDWIGDVVNVKNVALMLGPSAVVASGGKFVWWSSEIVDKGVTFKDVFCNAIRLPQIADKFAKTQAGQACIRELLKFDQSTGIVSKVVAEALVQQGIIKAGEMVGGRAGEFAAEVLTTLGVGDIDQTLRILEQNGIDAKTIDNIGKVLRQAADGIEEAAGSTKKYAGQVDNALKEITEGRSLTSASRQSLEDSRKEIEEKILKLINKTMADGDSRGVIKQLEEYQAMKAAIDDALSGNRAGASVARKAVDGLEDQAEKSAKELSHKAETCEEIAENLRKAEVPGKSLSKQAPEILDESGKKIKSLDDLVHNSGLEGPSDPKVPLSQRKIRLESDRAKDLKYFDKTPDGSVKPGFRSGLEEADAAMAKKDWAEAARRYKELYAEDHTDIVRAELRMKYEQAKAAADAVEQAASAPKNINDGILKKFSGDDADDIVARLKSGDYVLERVGKDSAQKPFWVVDKTTGEKITFIKPSTVPGEWDIKREAIGQRILEQLRDENAISFKFPTCTRIEVDIDGKRANCVVERVIRGADLEDLPVGHHYTVVDQLAEERAASAFLLDFDRHSANEKVDEALNLIPFDRGYSGLGQIKDIGKMSDSQLEAKIVRDFLSIGQDKPGKDVIIKNVENLITYNQMEGVVKTIEGWDPAKIKKMLDEVVDSNGKKLLTDDEITDTVRTFLAVQRNLGKSLEAKFPRVEMGSLPSLSDLRKPTPMSWLNPLRDFWKGWQQPEPALAGGWA